MCDPKALQQMQQLKPKLKCQPGTSCWCAQLLYRVDLPLHAEECMTPEEIYDFGKHEMCEGDKRYLRSLFGRRLVEE